MNFTYHLRFIMINCFGIALENSNNWKKRLFLYLHFACYNLKNTEYEPF